MTVLRGFVAGLALGFLLTVVPSCGGNACSSDTCESGCCDAEGECQPGSTRAACGPRGGTCATCEVDEACQLGFCIGLGSGSGDGGGGRGPSSNDGGGGSANAPDASMTFGPGCALNPAPCGGALLGTRYGYLEGCVEDLFGDGLPLCAPGSYQSQSQGTLYGTVEWSADGFISRNERRGWSSTLEVDATCAAAYSGCQGVKGALTGPYSISACQERDAGGCTCTGSRDGTRVSGTYVQFDGGTMRSSTETWDYCVTGDLLEIRDLTVGEGRAVYRLKKL